MAWWSCCRVLVIVFIFVVFICLFMILKLPWGGDVDGLGGVDVGFSELRGDWFVLGDGGFGSGGRLLDVVFEERFCRLVSFGGVRFFVLPRDGDFLNFGRDNLLLCGFGGRDGVSAEAARSGDLLWCWVDDGGWFHYECGGFDFSYDGFGLLRRRVAGEPGCLGLFNVNFLFSVDEYLCFFDDFVGGRVGVDGFCVSDYK